MTPRSLCAAHHARVSAELAAGNVPAGAAMVGGKHDAMAAALWADKRELKEIKSIAAKVERKRAMLPAYDDYVAGVLEGGQGAQDNVLMTVFAWRLDIGDLSGALDIGAYALRFGIAPPDQFQRDTPALLAEQLAEGALAVLDPPGVTDAVLPSDQAAGLLSVIERARDLTDDRDMHDQIRAKLHKAHGYALRAMGRREDAIEVLRSALALNERIGVKRDIELLERALKKAQEQGAAQVA